MVGVIDEVIIIKYESLFKVWYLRTEFVCKKFSMGIVVWYVELDLLSKNILSSTYENFFLFFYTWAVKLAIHVCMYIIYGINEFLANVVYCPVYF